MGTNLRLYLDHTGLTERYRTLKALRRYFDEDLRELTEWVQEIEGELESPVEEDDPPGTASAVQQTWWAKGVDSYYRRLRGWL